MEDRQLLGRAREGRDPITERDVVDDLLEAVSLDELAQHVPAHAGFVLDRSERDDARHSEPFEAGQCHRLSDERHDLALARTLREHLEREHLPVHAVANGPDLSAAALTEQPLGFIARRERLHEAMLTGNYFGLSCGVGALFFSSARSSP